MNRQDANEKLAAYHQQITDLRGKMRDLRQSVEPQPGEDHVFQSTSGSVRLSELFGDHDTLFVIHNMGASCPYCTLWADGFNGLIGHLENRAAFVVASPDDPAKQQDFKASRDWQFRMISHRDSSFAAAMGYKGEDGWMPGVSVFKREGGKILRVSDTSFGPGDDFCAIWHLFDLIPEGPDGWEPKYKY